MIQLGLIDDHNLFREGIKSLLDKMDGVTLALEASSGKGFFTQLKLYVPDVILLDLEMEDMDGIEITKRLKVEYPSIKIIILTMHKESRMISYLMEIGANGYLLKNIDPQELENAIQAVYKQGHYFSPLVSDSLLKELKAKQGITPSIGIAGSLTPREREVLEMIADEFTTSEIAEKLFLSVRTIEGYRKNLLDKMGVKNSAGLVRKAIKEKILHH